MVNSQALLSPAVARRRGRPRKFDTPTVVSEVKRCTKNNNEGFMRLSLPAAVLRRPGRRRSAPSSVAMFKKFSSEDISGQNQVKASVQRRIRQSIAEEYLLLEPLLEDMLPKKSPMIVVKCQNHLNLVVVNNVPLFFNIRDGPYMPTLRLLHQYPEIMKKFQVDRGAIKFVLSGANIMCPGLTSPGGVLDNEVEEETPVMAHNLLSQIHDKSNKWTICVVVSRVWHYRGGTDEGDIIHTDLVLLDREGTHMYGQIPPQPAEKLKNVLKEGKVFDIRKFVCDPSKVAFRAVESPYMVQFTRYSMVQEMPGMEDTFPFCTYSLTPFTEVPKPASPPARFIDVIGRITMVSDVIPFQAAHQTVASNTRTVVLTDLLGQEIRIILWGDRAVEFDAEAVRAMGAKEPVIAIFLGTLPKMAHGARGLSGSSACCWYIDEDIPDINFFRASLGDQFAALATYVPSGQDAFQVRVQQDPVETTVVELNKLDPFEDMEKRFLITITVDMISTDQRWWFPSCGTCHKSARVDGYQYRCTDLSCDSVDADLTYCVSIYASDRTGQAEFVLFDKVATAAIGKPLVRLMHQRYPGHPTMKDIAHVARFDMSTPPEIARLAGLKYKLLVAISKKAFLRLARIYPSKSTG